MRRSIFSTLSVAMTASLVLAGCGSDDGDESAGPSSPPANSASVSSSASTDPASSDRPCANPDTAVTPVSGPAPTGPATGDPIKIGAIGSYSGAQGDSIGAMDDTLKAWAAYTNANGGINGHPVELTVVDDRGDTAAAVTAANQMIKDGIIAFVGTGSTVDQAWASVASKANVPVIGSANYNPSFLAEPCFFSTGAQVPQMVYGALAAAKKAGVTKLGVLYCSGDAETPCSNFAKLFEGISAATVKIPFVLNQSIPGNNPTAALCLAAKNKGADGLIIIENSAIVAKFADICAQQNYRPIQVNVSGTSGAAWTESENMNGAIAAVSTASRASDIPPIATMVAALKKYAPGVVTGDQYNTLDVDAWAGGQMFARVGEVAGLTPDSTSEDVLAGLYALEGETLNGLTVPITYMETPGPAAPAFTTSYFLETVKDGQFAPLNGGKAVPIPADDLAAIVKLLQASAGG